MSIDFDSGALQTQHDEDDEYDKEDYAREQELQQLLTDLPHDMLDDSLSSSPEPNYSVCSGREASEHSPHWDHDRSWDSRHGIPNRQIPHYSNGYSANQYGTDYGGKNERVRNLATGETMSNGWHAVHSDDDRDTFHVNYNYPKEHSNNQSNAEDFHNGIQYDAPDPCSNSDLYHLPDDFQPYTNGHHQGEGFQGSDNKHFERFITSEGTHNQPSESVQVKYHPYQLNAPQKDSKTQDPARSEDNYDDLQREFLETGESSASNMQFVQLQILYKARGRQLHEFSEKLEESQQQMRYLNHQLVMVKDEKDGLAISLKESQALFQNAKETEVQLKGQMTALEKTIECLTSKEEQVRKELKIAKVAMESMQQQVMDMCRSDSIQRAREQHEAVVSMLTQKHDEQVFMLQQKLDSVSTALQEQKEECCRLENQVTKAERKLEECKVEKTEIINRLTKSLEECQKQCANLLQTGSIQEATQLRLHLQQIQSSKNITDGMNKALQDEIGELKGQITMYESAASLGVFTSGSEQEELSDSYVDLGIKKVNWRKSQFQRIIHNNGMRKDLAPDEIMNELKRELERCLNGNRVKRQQIIQLQSDLKVCHSKTEEMKMSLEKAEKNARDCEIRSGSLERQLGPDFLNGQSSNEALKEEIRKLQSEKQLLQQDIEKHLLCIKELKENEEKMKVANQELCNEMRGMIQDFDRDKKEAIERCERTYEQHHEDIGKHLQAELSERFASEKEHLCQHYEEKISHLQSQVDEITNEMTSVQECYITVCKEKDKLEQTVQENVKAELQINEGKIKDKLQKENENSLQTLKTELENKYEITLSRVKAEWEKEKELGLKQQIEAFVKLSKENWNKEQQQVTENIIRNVENEWKHKLEEALAHAKSKAVPNLEKLSVQTDQTLIVLDLENKLQDALKDKERAVHEVRRELELQYHEDISKQVESALIKARARWLQEFTSLPEYKTNLKLEQENWEQLHELNVKQQITEAVAAAEVNWRTKGDKADCTIRHKEYEKVASFQRELEQKNEECQALLKAELAKARAQWNKEKQVEIQQLQAQNEEDYRAFLDAQRTKISDVLSMAKGDFEKQKAELAAQKEADIKEQLNQNLKQWASEASQRLRDHENTILSEAELILAEIHDEMVDKRIKDRLHVSRSLHLPVFDQLRACLQRAIKGIVYKVLSTAKQEWDQKPDAGRAYHSSFPSSTPNGDVHKTAETSHAEELNSGGVQTGARNENLKRKDDGHECSRCAWCLLRIEKLKKECHELRVKLDKACRHLQQAVKEQKLKAEQIKENETHAESLRHEYNELLKKLEEIKTLKTQPSVPEEGNGCALCRGNALEEMRAQYIKAVDKIKNDMLRYIHESKGRAAEMLKSEVLRERQETARKMRKYYLTCLQQLLKDDGKNEGAEKKIMNAASKLATMAKVLETPISQKCQNKTIRTAVTLANGASPDTEQDKSDSQKPPCTWASNRPVDQPTEQNTMDELIKRHKREKAEGSNTRNNKEAVPPRTDQSSKQVRNDYPDMGIAHSCNLYSVSSKFSTVTALENAGGFTCLDAKAQAEHVAFPSQGKPSFLQCLKTYRGCTDLQTKPDKQRFDIQETPVRDENASNDWSFVTDKGPIPSHSAQCSSKSFRLQQTSNHPESFSAPGLFCLSQGIQDPSGSCSKGQHYSSSTVKRRDQDASTQPSNKNIGLYLTAVKNSADSKRSADPSRGNNLPSRKLLQNYVSPQQDSGFDSPFSDFHGLK